VHVLMCDAQCWGFEHARFNAGLVRTVQCAWPEARIHFLGERTHLEHVRSVMQQHGADDEVGLSWEGISIPAREARDWKRMPHEWSWSGRLINRARQLQPKLVVVCSVTNTSLLALKLAMHKAGLEVPTLALPHSSLRWLLKPPPRTPWNRLVGLRNVLRVPNPRALRLVALGPSVHKWVLKLCVGDPAAWVVLDAPYLWPEVPASRTDADAHPKVIRFGYLGMVMQGFELFKRLADEVSSEHPSVEFELVGFVPANMLDMASSPHVRGITTEPLSFDVFVRRADALTYAVGTRNPEIYKVISSVTFIDALACLKPGIYLRNPYLEHYFERMGDVGYLCDDYDALRDVVREICQEFPHERYRQQVHNILKGRRLFEPATVARQLRTIIDACEEDLRSGAKGRAADARVSPRASEVTS